MNGWMDGSEHNLLRRRVPYQIEYQARTDNKTMFPVSMDLPDFLSVV